jgi:sugar phosphate isomerase/epimerase
LNWRIGTSTGAWIGDDIGLALDAIEQAHLNAIEVGTPPGHFDPWNIDALRALSARLSGAGIVPVSIHAPFGGLLDLSDPNPHHRHAALGGIVASASALRDLGGRVVVVHTTDVPRNGEDIARRLADCASALRVLVRSCHHMGMTVAIENPLPHLIGGHPDEFEWILKNVGDTARVCLDTSHATLGGHWQRLFELTGERVVHVHANDHHGDRDEHLAPGDGVVPWTTIGADLCRVGYSGWLILELNRDNSSSAARLERAREQLVRLLGPCS